MISPNLRWPLRLTALSLGLKAYRLMVPSPLSTAPFSQGCISELTLLAAWPTSIAMKKRLGVNGESRFLR